MSTMTDKQRAVDNAADFREAFGFLHAAAVGVVVVRTREPHRAIDTLKTFAFSEQSQQLVFKSWSILHGWATYERNSATPNVDASMIDPIQALRAINGVGEAPGFPNGIYCFLYPHMVNLNKNPAMVQCVKEYVRFFAQNKKRLVLVVPPGYELPQELVDDIIVLDFEPPSYAELRRAYERLISNLDPKKRPNFSDEQVDRILSAGAGMVQHEFDSALSRAIVENRKQLTNDGGKVKTEPLLASMVEVVMKVKVESVKKSPVLNLMDSEDMGEVGGLDNLKAWLAKRATCFGQEARDFGIEPPKGIALIGPPGTGKSLMARATAWSLQLPLIKFDVGSVFQSLVGQSEERIKAALSMVDAMAPCVLFIDEVDKAFQANSGGTDSGVGQRVLGAILQWMSDGTKPVFLVVTANRVNNMPAEFLRRGRLDEVFSVNMPNEDERREVFQIHLRKRGHDPETIGDLETAVTDSSGFVPAEIEQAVKDALIEAFTSGEDLTGELISAQFGDMTPLAVAFADDFRAMSEWATNNAKPANEGEPVSLPEPVRKRSRQAAVPGTDVNRDGMNLDG